MADLPPRSAIEALRRQGWSIPAIARRYQLPSTLPLIPVVDDLDRRRGWRIRHPSGHAYWPDPDGGAP